MQKKATGSKICIAIVAAVLTSAFCGVAHADKVGVAAAVNPDAFSSLSGSPQTQLNIGKSIFFNERINTATSGLVQVLLVDGSTFTVGPGSDLVIDKFVYDPNKKTGEVVATFTKGAMRFVGGKISKNEGGVTVNTPAGALAIRGGMFMTNGKVFAFLFGEHMTLTGKNGQSLTVFAPGNLIDTTTGDIREIKPGDIAALMAALTPGSNGGVTPGQTPQPAQNGVKAATLSNIAADVINEATATQIQDAINKEIANLTNTPTDTPGDTPGDTPTDTTTPPVDTTDNGPTPCVDCDGTPPGKLEGYAGGVYLQSPSDEGKPPVGVLANTNSTHVSFTFNDDQETFSALFKLRVGGPGSDQGGVDIKFGDDASNPETPHSLINQYGFAALSQPNGIKIFHDNQTEAPLVGTPFALLASSGLFDGFDSGDSENLSHVPDRPSLPIFCSDCNFLKWGVFLAAASFEDPQQSGDPIQRHVGILGWWVAGDIPAVGQLPVTGTASYRGDALATVSTNLFTEGWDSYVATGKMGMDWNFGKRQGGFAIVQFDTDHFDGGLTFSGPMCAPGVAGCGTNTPGGNHFGGPLNGQLPNSGPTAQLTGDARNLSGFALGSFVRGPNNFDVNGVAINRSIPQGVIGNWGVGNASYVASGIFAGSHVVPTQ